MPWVGIVLLGVVLVGVGWGVQLSCNGLGTGASTSCSHIKRHQTFYFSLMALSINQMIPSPLRICRLRRVRRCSIAFVFTGIVFSLMTFAFKKLELNRSGYTLILRSKHMNLPALRGIKVNDSTVNL